MEIIHCKKVSDIEKDVIECPWSQTSIEEICQNKSALCRVCLDKNGDVVGYYTMYIICDEGNINNIAVAKKMQKNGIGNILMQDMTNQAKILDIKALTLEVNINNIIAERLYEKFGFKIQGIRKNFYNNTDDALIMWKM